MQIRLIDQDNNYNVLLKELYKYPNIDELSIYFDEKLICNINENPNLAIKKINLSYFPSDNKNKQPINFTDFKNLLNLFPNLEKLDAWNLKAKHVEQNINFPKLKYLKLVSNNEEHMSEAKNIDLWFKNSPLLEEVYLKDICNYFPEVLFNLKNLKKLEIELEYVFNGKVHITDAVSNWSNLEELKIKLLDVNRKIDNILISPKINTLKSLKKISFFLGGYIHKATSFTWPDGIENLQKLEHLELYTVKSNPKGIEKLNLITKKIKL